MKEINVFHFIQVIHAESILHSNVAFEGSFIVTRRIYVSNLNNGRFSSLFTNIGTGDDMFKIIEKIVLLRAISCGFYIHCGLISLLKKSWQIMNYQRILDLG